MYVYTTQYNVGRPPARWTDDLKRVSGSDWMAKTGDRVLWRTLGEAYVQQWTQKADDDGVSHFKE